MKHFLLIIFASSMISVQDTSLLDRFYKNVSESCVGLSYTYTTRVSGINTSGQGILSAQDMMWKVSGNGVEMYCDSATTWVIDPSAKEVVIERTSSDAAEAVITNPALMVAMADKLFAVNEVLTSDDGKSMIYVLKPKSDSTIDFMNVELRKTDAAVIRASFALTDGTLVKIEVSSMKLTPKVSDESFRPRTKFDSSWIVTDLR